MAKRFTDSDKWKKIWFRSLPDKSKLFWIYILDSCTVAGVWEVDFEMAKFFLGEFDIETIKINLKKQYKEINNGKSWLINDFISFQYGKLTNHPFHEKIQKEIDTLSDRVSDTHKVKEEVKEEVKEVIEDLNLVLGTAYKSNSKQTKQHINARIAEGHTIEDFKKVHRTMLKNWGADPKMCKYLRPQTLYSPKFESYLNMKEISTKLTENGVRAYIIGQEWLRKHQEKENVG